MYSSAESVTADPSLQLARAVCCTPKDKDRQTCKQKGGTLGQLELVQPVNDVNPSAVTTSDTDQMAIDDPYELVGCTFLMDPQDDKQIIWACIIDFNDNHKSDVLKCDDHYKFCISVNEDQYEEVSTCNELMDFIQKNKENEGIIWHFHQLVGHQGQLLHSDPNYNGSTFNVLMEWENGEIMAEPSIISHSSRRSRVRCMQRNPTLFDTEGWKHFWKQLSPEGEAFLMTSQ
jgi:hypothetical protein